VHRNLDKFGHIVRLLDTLYLARNESFSDHAKRVVMRFFFIQIDNLEKLAGRVKNQLVASGHLKGQAQKDVEAAIKKLLGSYTNSLDQIRDKIAAHAQPLELDQFLALWGGIDYSLIELLYGDIDELDRAFRVSGQMTHARIGADYAPLRNIAATPLARDQPPILAMDRAGLTRENAVSIIPQSQSQKLAQLGVSIVDALLIDFWLTTLVNNPQTVFAKLLFDIGWFMVIVDTCSLIDVLFNDTMHAPSIRSIWRMEGMKGLSQLDTVAAARDSDFETSIRDLRNRLAAHIDAEDTLEALYDEYDEIDLVRLHSYSLKLLQAFQHACRIDIRTKMFAAHGQPITQLAGLQKPSRPFDDT